MVYLCSLWARRWKREFGGQNQKRQRLDHNWFPSCRLAGLVLDMGHFVCFLFIEPRLCQNNRYLFKRTQNGQIVDQNLNMSSFVCDFCIAQVFMSLFLTHFRTVEKKQQQKKTSCIKTDIL